jgi:hypothetical protein
MCRNRTRCRRPGGGDLRELRSTSAFRAQIGELRDRLGGLPSPAEADGIWRGIWLEEAGCHSSMSIASRLIRALKAPARAWRYLTRPPAGGYHARYEAMSPEQKEQARWQSTKRNGLFLAFVNLKRAPK